MENEKIGEIPKLAIEDEIKFFNSILEQCTEENLISKNDEGYKQFKLGDMYVGQYPSGLLTISYIKDYSLAATSRIPHIEYRYDKKDPTNISGFRAEYRPVRYTPAFAFDGIEGIFASHVPSDIREKISEFFKNNPDASIPDCIEQITKNEIYANHYVEMGGLSDILSLRSGIQERDKVKKSKFISDIVSEKFYGTIEYCESAIAFMEKKLPDISSPEHKEKIIKKIEELKQKAEKLKEEIEKNNKEDEENELADPTYERKSYEIISPLHSNLRSSTSDSIKLTKEILTAEKDNIDLATKNNEEIDFLQSMLQQCTEDKRDLKAEKEERVRETEIYKFDNFYVLKSPDRSNPKKSYLRIQYTTKPFPYEENYIEYHYDKKDPTNLQNFEVEYRTPRSTITFHGRNILEDNEEINEFFKNNPEATIQDCVETIMRNKAEKPRSFDTPEKVFNRMSLITNILNLRKGLPRDESKYVETPVSLKDIAEESIKKSVETREVTGVPKFFKRIFGKFGKDEPKKDEGDRTE